MIGLGTLSKFARMANASSIDQILELLQNFGLDVDIQELMEGQKPTAFQQVSQQAARADAKVLMIRSEDADGSQMLCLMVSAPSPARRGQNKVLALPGDVAVGSGGRALEAPGEPNR